MSPFWRHQSGNAVVLVLIGVILFGALAYTFMRGGKPGQGNLNKQQAKIAAQQILDYASTIERSIDKLRGKGCTENQISFDYDIPATTGYENANSPGDFLCHIFNAAGAGLAFTPPPTAITGPWFFKTLRVYMVGTDQTFCAETAATPCNEIVAMLANVNSEICKTINSIVNNNDTIFAQDNGTNYESSGNTKFIGSFSSGSPDIEMTPYNVKNTGCILGTNGKNYFFYAVLPR